MSLGNTLRVDTVYGSAAYVSAVQIPAGLEYNAVAAAWQSPPVTPANMKFPLVANAQYSDQKGVEIGTLGTYTGTVLLRVHDDATDDVLALGLVELETGEHAVPTVQLHSDYGDLQTVPSQNQEIVSPLRTWVLRNYGSGLEGEKVLQAQAGETRIFAFDFREDIGTSRVSAISTVEPETPTADLTLTALGADHSQAKVRIAVAASPTPGEHRIRCIVTYVSGETVEGDGRLAITD